MTKKRLWQRVTRYFTASSDSSRPLSIPRSQHSLSRGKISPNALKVLYRLKTAGFAAYLVGGGVRDLLLGRTPKDFDIATDATPEKIRRCFRNSRMIGRRFRLVHIYFSDEVIEVSTFRANADESIQAGYVETEAESAPAMITRDNTYGTIEEDAWRRDFTVNALYYNIADFSVVDYTGGMTDLQQHTIRIIGDPVQRFHEDPIRLLRAIRLAAKLQFKIHADTKEQLLKLPNLLQHVPEARLFDEALKLLLEGNAAPTYELLVETGYMQVLFPRTMQVLSAAPDKKYQQFIRLALRSSDERFAKQQFLSAGFLFSVLLWPVLQAELVELQARNKKFHSALYYGMQKVIKVQQDSLMVPKRFALMMKSIWMLQYHLQRRRPKSIGWILRQRFFRAAYDFFLLRAEVGQASTSLADWWQRIQQASEQEYKAMIEQLRQEAS